MNIYVYRGEVNHICAYGCAEVLALVTPVKFNCCAIENLQIKLTSLDKSVYIHTHTIHIQNF